MIKDREYMALAFHSTLDEYHAFLKFHTIKFSGKISRNGVYHESILSNIDIKNRLISIVSEIDSKDDIFEEKILSLNSLLCRSIFIDNKECMFLISEDIDTWGAIAHKFGYEDYNLLNDVVIDKFRKFEFFSLSEILFKVKSENEESSMIIRGENLENAQHYKEIFPVINEVLKYKRKQENYIVEVIKPNIVIFNNIQGDFNLRKSLSKIVVRGTDGK